MTVAEQQAFFDPGKLNPHQFPAVPEVQEAAKRYTHGAHTTEGLDERINTGRQQFAVAGAYREALNKPEAPGLRKSYVAMKNSVNKQYDLMTRPKEAGGLGLRHELVHDKDPYGGTGVTTAGSAKQMGEDVHRGVIKTMSTEATGGHAFFSNEENDKFRAVHDVFGHAATGRGFDAPGEEVAYLSHRQMFPKRALAALTSETRGQNAYLNRRRGIPGFTAGEEAQFPPQSKKLVGLPPAASRVRPSRR